MKSMLSFTALAVVGMMAAATPARAQSKDIVDTAVAAGSFTTLAKALTAADLVATVKGPGPFTVFAPTDEAFELSSAKAVSGDTLSIAHKGGAVTVDKANVVKTDIAASNGVIHVVDTVLLPPGK
jgi:uncharacterized surface protein with fasciclin (FAS1) repeats